MSSLRSVLTLTAFIVCGLWGTVAWYLAPISVVFAARGADVPLGTYLLLLANVVLPFTLMVLAFRLRRPRTSTARPIG